MEDTSNLITKLRGQYEITSRPTNDIVDSILHDIDKPGLSRETKRDVILQLFPNAKNRQGIHIVETLESYGGY